VSNPVLIFGASGGIGSAIARRLAQDGMKLVLHGRRRDRLDALAAELGGDVVTVQAGDLTDPVAVSEVVARLTQAHGKIGGAVFSVATPFPNLLAHRTPWSAFQEQLDGQLKALHTIATACFPLLADTGETTRFVVLSSEAVIGQPPIKRAPYVAAKAAMTAYAQTIAQEWLKRGIRVHIVAPGLVKTDLVASMPDEYLQTVAAEMPEKRLTSAADVANFVSFLFTDAADPLYGITLQVSRGIRK